MKQSLKSLILLFASAIAFVYFLAVPLPLLSSGNGLFRRGLLLLLPLTDPSLFFHQIFGDSVMLFDTDRFMIIGVGLTLLAAVLGSGRFMLLAIRRLLGSNEDFDIFTPREELFFAFLIGLASLSAYLFWAGLFGWINRYTALPILLFALSEIVLWIKNISEILIKNPLKDFHFPPKRLTGAGIFAALLFVLAGVYLLAGTIPPFEYDMLEYHAQGAREIFESGGIQFSQHNVYLNMPLGSEMFYLAGILLMPSTDVCEPDSLCLGVTAGKFFLAFVPLFCAMGASLFIERLVNPHSRGRLIPYSAAISVLAIPEIFQVSANGLNDIVLGLAVLGTLYASYLALNKNISLRRHFFFLLLSGLFTGFAAACKYTAIPFLVLPIVIAVFLISFLRFGRLVLVSLFTFVSAAMMTGGGWYLKNLLLTGNPFYPLAYSFFGDRTGIWNAAKNARWISAHFPRSFHMIDFLSDVGHLLTDNFSSVLFPLLLIFLTLFFIRLFRRKENRSVVFLTFYLLFFFFLWWFTTHRLLRFLVPVFPIAAVVTTYFWLRGYMAAGSRPLRAGFLSLWIISAIYALSINLISTPGILVPIKSLVSDPARYGAAAFLSGSPMYGKGSESTLLLVGEARAFAFRFSPILYNTCWDNSPLSELLQKNDNSDSAWTWTDDDVRKIKENFRTRRIQAILVDYNEIQRFLSDGNYGLTDSRYADPMLFESLATSGVLETIPLPEELPNIKYYRVTEL